MKTGEKGMTTDLVKPGENPFLDYGNAATQRAIVGKLLKFQKGDYIAGMDSEEVPEGTRLVAVMDSLLVGHQKWQDSKPVEQRMGLVVEGYQPERRVALGDIDQSRWEVDDDDKPKDPWQFTNQLLMIDPELDQIYTFSTSSKGGISAIGELSKAYGKQVRQRPDELPVIALGVGSYLHSDRKLGRIKYPTFEIVSWVDKAPFLTQLDKSASGDGSKGDGNAAPPKTVAKPATPASKVKAAPDKTTTRTPQF
jgi:hypothetical protein